MNQERKKKVLMLYNKVWHYRIPIFNLVNKQYDLTVVYYLPPKDDDLKKCEFKTIYCPTIKIGFFLFSKINLNKLSKEFDIVIIGFSPQVFSYYSLAFGNRKYKTIMYSIGAPASYHRHYGEASKLHYAFSDFIEKRGDAMMFYSDAAVKLHLQRGFDRKKMFVANNTTYVLKRSFCPERKNSILFIGSLYMEKGIQLLLDAYKLAYQKKNDIFSLHIVGGGHALPNIREWVEENHFENNINIWGPVYDDEIKADLFQKAYACISPLQGGLSVLESMGYGAPYITDINAITGGEAFNIENGKTGLRVERMSVETLSDIIIDIFENSQKYIEMGRNAYNYYWRCRKPEDMAAGYLQALDYVSNL